MFFSYLITKTLILEYLVQVINIWNNKQMGALTMRWGELEKNSEIKKRWGSGAGESLFGTQE